MASEKSRPCCITRSSIYICMIIGTAAILLISYTTFFNGVHALDKNNPTEVIFNKRISMFKTASKVHTKTADIVNILTRFDDRRKRVEIICDKQRPISGKAQLIISNIPHNISVCMVPKAGITIWTRLFKFLKGQKKYTGNPMSISKYEAHYKDLHITEQIYKQDQKFIVKSLRVMTVRNPYTRLWSAYIDKFVLPDFWQYKGKKVIKMTRPNASATSMTCGNDVTFTEFIQYVVTTGHALTGYDNHWAPESDVCDPCIFKPTLIINQESFMPDFSFVMKEINLLPLLSNMTLVDPVDFEIKNEINYNFEIAKLHSKCMDIVGICERIWQAFALNGYIPPTEKFPSELINNKVTWDKMHQVIKDVRTRNNITKRVTLMLRKQALRDAFANISDDHLQKLQKLFKMDFQLFGFDKNITSVFY